MHLGVHLPQSGPTATRSGVLAVARTAEAAGLDSVWVADHVVLPIESASVYPYSRGGVPFDPGAGLLEALTMLAVVAGATETIGLGTSVLVLPQREPLLAAKSIASLDVLSDGRTRFVLGAGWWAEEFAALGVAFEGRGGRFDEQLAILRSAWNDGTLAHRGAHFDFDEVACLPRPVQPGGPPILIGGTSARALRRAGELGDGWHCVGASADRLRAGRAAAAAAAVAAGRDPDRLTLSTTCSIALDADAAVERLGHLADAGCDQVVLNFAGVTDAAGICRALEWFATSVTPRLGTAPVPSR